MKCSQLHCSNEAASDSSFCSEHQPTGLVLPMKRTEEQNVEEAKKIRELIGAALARVADEMNAAKNAGYYVAFNIEADRVGKYYISTLVVARNY